MTFPAAARPFLAFPALLRAEGFQIAPERHGAQPRLACGRAPPWAWSARRIFSGLIGRSSMRTPTAL